MIVWSGRANQGTDGNHIDKNLENDIWSGQEQDRMREVKTGRNRRSEANAKAEATAFIEMDYDEEGRNLKLQRSGRQDTNMEALHI